jgi:hypothetical protein
MSTPSSTRTGSSRTSPTMTIDAEAGSTTTSVSPAWNMFHDQSRQAKRPRKVW